MVDADVNGGAAEAAAVEVGVVEVELAEGKLGAGMGTVRVPVFLMVVSDLPAQGWFGGP
ncbi:hypothetical protein [Frankia sp. AiPa1]|uniref:hypothetical protein n=1 Tax=Frankia sp. AiPa1 TaxID=573492 RepID=UPI00202BA491|nr:hypothetical protein [Frankia sp. AiPa1]